jgi:hypothetical protein
VTRIQKSECRRQKKRKKKDKGEKKRTKQGSHTEHTETTEINRGEERKAGSQETVARSQEKRERPFGRFYWFVFDARTQRF